MLLTIKDVAREFKVSTQTIRRWSDSGKIPAPLRVFGGSIRWRALDIERWLESPSAQNGEAGEQRYIEQAE